jgi:hypothetical protein
VGPEGAAEAEEEDGAGAAASLDRVRFIRIDGAFRSCEVCADTHVRCCAAERVRRGRRKPHTVMAEEEST